jgi:hypothetical protein
VRVTGRAKLRLLARNTLKELYANTNPVSLETAEQVLETLTHEKLDIEHSARFTTVILV